MSKYVNDYYYEVFEYHTLPRGLMVLTLRITETGASQYIQHKGHLRIPKGSLTVCITRSEAKPTSANFLLTRNIGNNKIKHSTTKSFKVIHNHIDTIREALNYTKLDIYLGDKYHNPYEIGKSYEPKGIYHGVRTKHFKQGTSAKYHYFTNNVGEETKEYFNDNKYDKKKQT